MAVNVSVPTVVSVIRQFPALTEPEQLAAPSLTVTVPVGVPLVAVTAYVTVTVAPVAEGFGVCDRMVVVVFDLLLTWSGATFDTPPLGAGLNTVIFIVAVVEMS